MAALLGTKMAEGKSEAADRAEVFGELRREVDALEQHAVVRRAYGLAASQIADEIVKEIRGEEEKPQELRLSDPRNVALRNREYAERAVANVHRLSGGARSFNGDPTGGPGAKPALK